MALRTGIPELDQDLEELIKYLSNTPVAVTPQDFSNRKDIHDLIPQRAADAALALADDEQFEELMQAVIPSEGAKLKELREQVMQKLGPWVNDRNFVDLVESTQEDEAGDDASNLDAKLGSPSDMQVMPYLRIAGSRLIPELRVLINARPRVVADMTLSWGDLTFLLRSLAGSFVDHVSSAEPYAKNAQVIFGQERRKKIIAELQETIADVERVQEGLRKYEDGAEK